MCNEVEEYMGIVLSQIECSETKRVVAEILHSKIDEVLQKQCISNDSKEQLVKCLIAKLGDPLMLGQYYAWLKNLVDLR